MPTVYLQGDDAQEFMDNGYCDDCLAAAPTFAKYDQYGNVEVPGYFDFDGSLVGFRCWKCAAEEKEVR